MRAIEITQNEDVKLEKVTWDVLEQKRKKPQAKILHKKDQHLSRLK